MSYQTITGNPEPLDDDILVYEMDQGVKLVNGIIRLDDSALTLDENDARNARGIRARWAKVYKVGKNVDYVSPDEFVLVEHGRWTHTIDVDTGSGTIIKLQKIDTSSILLVSEEL